jgi:hypothetical protein
MENEHRSSVDRFVEKVISRKFLAWITATGLIVYNGLLTSEDWVIITAIYIGGQTVVDVVVKLRGR